MCDVDGTDPFTMDMRLCDDDRMVRRGAMHHGTDYLCTGHAHQFGQHIRCTNPAHYTALVVPAAVCQCQVVFSALGLYGDAVRFSTVPGVRLVGAYGG